MNQPQRHEAAQLLEGKELPTGWRITAKIPRPTSATGGNFSVGYLVERNGERAFLKALDYSRAFRSPDVARALQAMTSAFNFEVDILERCSASRMDRIVLALDHGQIEVPEAPGLQTVSYVIFELADGDVRDALDTIGPRFDYAWTFRTLHHAATGLLQLHNQQMAHQDVKPSNVLTFGPASSKLADLGRSYQVGISAPHHDDGCAGDPAYAPPELLYGQVAEDWRRRRQACDMYLLGSLVVFLFSGVTTTAEVISGLRRDQRPENWTGSYANILPYIRVSFDRAMSDFGSALPTDMASQVVPIVRQMSDPDPGLRGHPRTRASRATSPYSLERYVAQFDLLARRAEIGVFRDAV